MISISNVQQTLTDRFGPINQEIEWYGVREHGLDTALAGYPHLIDKAGIMSQIEGDSARASATAYIAARLTIGKDLVRLDHLYCADMTNFGFVATMADIEDAEYLLGKPLDSGRSHTEPDIHKATFVSPQGLLAVVRQARKGDKRHMIVNHSGLTEINISEMLHGAQEVVSSQVNKRIIG